MEKVRFFHAADLHLDSPFVGLKQLPKNLYERIQQSTFASFENLIEKAILRDIDFLIISGDLFDEEDRSIRAQAKIRRQFSLLHDHGIPVYVIHGNHDHLGGFRLDIEMPDNVHIFTSQTEVKSFITKKGVNVDLVGFSYGARHIKERRIEEFPKRSEEYYTIGLLHGSEASVNSSHETYAPFSKKELLEKNYHYWALGHIHERQVLHVDPYIVYPGNIQGRHRKETGVKGCYEVEMEGHHTEVAFVPTQDIIWDSIKVSLEGVQRFGEIYQRILLKLDDLEDNEDQLVEVILTDYESLPKNIIGLIDNGDLLEALQSDVEHQETLKWIYSLRWSRTQHYWLDEKDPFKNDIMRTLDGLKEEEWDEAFSELYEHPSVYRFLQPLNKEKKQRMIQDARELFFNPMNN
ncbi:metallophosphoesterase family protein [Rossellomorea aquimaris]|uniref:metallophosphoesterase family protein n=1 Tax=Rossellomorea aquimaris TaxID=189382 RepID=UPI0007D0A1EC|nr:DNA repair exonuclease [Rossellomorea aquimaris]